MTQASQSPRPKPYLLILYYSLHNSTAEMAKVIAQGVDSVSGIESKVRTVPKVSTVCEATEDNIPHQGPIYCSDEDLRHCSGLILGSPARYGNMAAPLKYFLDGTSAIWASGALVNKPAGAFTSSSSLHGGQEAALLSMLVPLMHHGMVIAGVPYTEPTLLSTQTGGTPYGPSHVSGADSSRPIDQDEKQICHAFGQRMGKLALQLLVGGK